MTLRSLKAARAATVRTPPTRNLWWLLLWAFCVLELFVIQQRSLDLALWRGESTLYAFGASRLILDTLFLGALLRLLPPRGLVAVFGLQAVFYGCVLSYFLYYERSLSIFTVLAQSSEGASVGNAALSVLGGWVYVLVGGLAVKLSLLWAARRQVGLGAAWPTRSRGLHLLGAYALMFVLVNSVQRPVSRLGTWAEVGAVGYLYGYLPTWAGELVYRPPAGLLERALKRAQKSSDRLTGHEAPLPLRKNLVFLQVESLDYAALGFEVKTPSGKRGMLTPEIDALVPKSMFYKVLAPKIVGSCDSDFTALMAKLPSSEVPVYRIDDYPYSSAITLALRDAGFELTSVHGVGGTFFSRRPAFEQMGFTSYFREELIEELSIRDPQWTVSDTDVLNFGAKLLRRGGGRRKFQLAITATSHIPFSHTPVGERVFFPGEAKAELAFFDAMHYVDESVGAYVKALPPDTTLVLYGDHWSKVENDELGFKHEVRDGHGMVPLIIYNTGEDISGLQRSRDGLAQSGELTLLDMFTWLHREVLEQVGDAKATRVRLAATRH